MTTKKRPLLFLSMPVALLIIQVAAPAQMRERFEQELHKTYPLSANGRVSVENITGAIHIRTWDRNEVKIDAVKRAHNSRRLAEAEIRIEASAEAVSVKTLYRGSTTTEKRDNETTNTTTTTWDKGGRGELNNPASVEYVLTVPKTARIDELRLVNGTLKIEGIARQINAGCVNANIFLDLPASENASVKAVNLNGAIRNDFGFQMRRDASGQEVSGLLGDGAARVNLNNVNGNIVIRRAQSANK
jgi:DUF4097 and DUF4098 domain-containing protein YvlB